jgi:hypothetical protein
LVVTKGCKSQDARLNLLPARLRGAQRRPEVSGALGRATRPLLRTRSNTIATISNTGISSIGSSLVGLNPCGDAPGIGRNLAEHPKIWAILRLAPGVVESDGDTPSIGFILRWSSGVAGCGEADLQVGALNHTEPNAPEVIRVIAAVMEPFSRGAVTLVSDDPTVDPRVEFRLLWDARDAIRMRLAAQELFALLGDKNVRAITRAVSLDESDTTPDDLGGPRSVGYVAQGNRV